MKTTFKIIGKCFFLVVFFCMTPFFDSCKKLLPDHLQIANFLFERNPFASERSLKEELNLLSSPHFLKVNAKTFTFETTNAVYTSKKETNQENINGKKIYIYSTHQGEDYSNEATVMDASALLAQALQEKGYQVIVETNDFNAYARNNGFDYNTLYQVSSKFISDAFVTYSGFDLVIDLHRDATPRETTILETPDRTYAKIMCVVGGLASYHEEVYQNALTLTDIINGKVNGIMKQPMVREGYYNQGMARNMMLIELGSNTNTFEEIKHSIPILAQGIDEWMR